MTSNRLPYTLPRVGGASLRLISAARIVRMPYLADLDIPHIYSLMLWSCNTFLASGFFFLYIFCFCLCTCFLALRNTSGSPSILIQTNFILE